MKPIRGASPNVRVTITVTEIRVDGKKPNAAGSEIVLPSRGLDTVDALNAILRRLRGEV